MIQPKKSLGQHFLQDKKIAQKIASSISEDTHDAVLEVGPGTGALTQHLLTNTNYRLWMIEKDADAVQYLLKTFPDIKPYLINNDFLQFDISSFCVEKKINQLAIVGNFPYNISSQIVFKVLAYRTFVPEMIGMFQKEVAQRLCATYNNKQYGILSVLCDAFFEREILFNIKPGAFFPPPKVDSAVIRLKRKENFQLSCDEVMFFKVVKTAFGQRRKIISNTLKAIFDVSNIADHSILKKRAEQLNTADFIWLTQNLKPLNGH